MPKKTKEDEEKRIALLWQPEKELIKSGRFIIAGVDEAGRGPLAGPVFAAAVILPEGEFIENINDSKKLTPQKREALYDTIKEKSIAYASAVVDEKVIDEINILNASMLAMQNAVAKLNTKPEYALIDGNKTPQLNIPCSALIKGDSKSISIAAASIIAKVERDRYMTNIAEKYPEYGFEKHKGYGTKQHNEAILKYGPCPIHRKTFLKKLLGDKYI